MSASTNVQFANLRLQDYFNKYPSLSICKDSINTAFKSIVNSFSEGSKLLLCGNGGSASDADHISGELLKGFEKKRPLQPQWLSKLGVKLVNELQGGLPAIPLANFTSLITAFCNDCNPEYVYAQLVWSLGCKKDILFCISTSGNSSNILHAATVARAKGLYTIGLTGRSGGKLSKLTNVSIKVPAEITREIQEYHLPIYHILCLMIEDYFFK